jgi:peptidoglycan hydrolase-like protein with peptidoglycan-binding domain
MLLQQGSRGEKVERLQSILAHALGYEIAVDGIFGPATAAAVADFQQKNGLAPDSIVGPRTASKLVEVTGYDSVLE